MTLNTAILYAVCLFFSVVTSSYASLSLGLQAVLPTLHLSQETFRHGARYSYKLTASGRLVWMPGGTVFLETSVSDPYLSIRFVRFSFAFYKDCMSRASGMLHLGPRWQLLHQGKWGLTVGVGPVFWWRESWVVFDFYQKTDEMTPGNGFLEGYEYKWLVYGDVTVSYALSTSWQVVYTLVPAIPYVMTQSLGFRRTL